MTLKTIPSYFWHHKKIATVVLVFVALLGFFLFPRSEAEIETQKVQKSKIVQSITASGSLQSETAVDLTFLTGGKVTYVGVKKGDMVEAWQTIATLDSRTVRKNLESALIDYSKQRNTFDEVYEDNGKQRPEQAGTDDLKRILSNNQYDLNKAIISVELQDLALQQSVLSTPIAGIVTRADIQAAGLNVGPTATFSVADPENLVFQIDVDEADIGRISLDQIVQITFDAYPDHAIPLQISYIDFASHKSETGSNVYTVEAKLPPNSDTRYRIGMNGDAEIIIAEKQNSLTVPISSLTDDNHVYVKTENGFEKRKVTLGLESDVDYEVTRGVKAGEEVALQPEEAAKQVVTDKKRFMFF